MVILTIIFILFISTGSIQSNKYTECASNDDPHMITFDGSHYEFQYPGDHYIMYDDFKDIRVTAGYQKCGGATCNCAAYLKKGRKIVFVDFCDVTSDLSPTSQIYGVFAEKNSTGLDSIKKMPPCKVINKNDENNPNVWKNIPTFLDDFQCAVLQGSNHHSIYVIRTVEKHFEESVKMTFKLATRTMPTLNIAPSKSSFENTGGLCGLWDGSRAQELFVIDADGVEEFFSFGNVPLARDFWKLQSRYNKDVSMEKRCPECYLISERSFYCPCDEFDMFDITNYNIPRPVPERTTYCKVPMHKCIEKYSNIIIPTPTTTTNSPDISTTTKRPLTINETYEICLEGFLTNPQLAELIAAGCIDIEDILEFCSKDVMDSGDLGWVDFHIQVVIDNSIQNILTVQENCSAILITNLCPKNCSGNGVCVFNENCIDDNNGVIRNIDDECALPVKCKCNEGYGGIDCSLNLNDIVDFTLDKDCCDLRNEKCDQINVFGFPFSIRDKIYAKIELVEYGMDTQRIVLEFVEALILSQNNLFVKIGKINELILFKYINNLPSDFILDESTAIVNIYLSYKESVFEKKQSFKLYDSKCRNCNKNNQITSLLQNKCEINGKCFNNLEANPEDSSLLCKPEIDVFTWTDLLCYGNNQWSEWYNLDKPDGDGDLEITEVLEVGCKNPTRFQVQTVDKVPYDQTGQQVYLDSCYGFICLNKENDPPCLDYMIRKCCPK